ncbi:MAG: c-type cytochrome, partial [Cellvibrionaceae bacterium]|nr:c-type cytochrome [Cellvibrionaceae bacterium]
LCCLLLSLLCLDTETLAQAADSQSHQRSGGEATVFTTGANAFSLPSATMPLMKKLDFSAGNSFFRNPWVVAPASTQARDGLGPLMNANGCQNCHIKDGRGHAPESATDNAMSLLLRLSIPASSELPRQPHQGVIPEPVYGSQLQDFGIPGVAPEGSIHIRYHLIEQTLAGGERVYLRKPLITVENLAYGDLHDKVQLSARIAPPMIGLGLLEAISEADILANVDESDKDNDGISGRANRVWHVDTQQLVLGRFGWKAGQPTIRQQNAAAFQGDLGISSRVFAAENCTQKQRDCLKAPTGGQPEVSDAILDLVTFYTKNLAVPARRNSGDAQVIQGETLFEAIGCAACHRPQFTTATAYAMPWLAKQTIYPYTDLLLHDMGAALADHRPEFDASGREWRTPPLWGIGLTAVVNKPANFLHDGRARNLQEAILWHGGEARASRLAYVNLPRVERAALLAFLQSL